MHENEVALASISKLSPPSLIDSRYNKLPSANDSPEELELEIGEFEEFDQDEFNETFKSNVECLKQEESTKEILNYQDVECDFNSNLSNLSNLSNEQRQGDLIHQDVTTNGQAIVADSNPSVILTSQNTDEEMIDDNFLENIHQKERQSSLNSIDVVMKNDDEDLSSSTPDDHLNLEQFRDFLRYDVIDYLKTKNISKLFQWQFDCIHSGDVLNGQNLVFCAPTSAGKSIIPDILLLKRVLACSKKALIVLPYISLANEKVNLLEKMLKYTNLNVGGFMGNSLPSGSFPAVDIAVATIEKANNIINRLIQEDKLNEIGIVIVDELHEIGVSERGNILEQLLIKIKYSNLIGKCNIQIVGMSATLPNLDEIARWLNAQPFRTDYRPIPLTEMININEEIRNVQTNEIIKNLSDIDIKIREDASPPTNNSKIEQRPAKEQPPIHACLTLALETILSSNGVLVFCSSKLECEKQAEKLSSKLNDLYRYKDGPENVVNGRDKLKVIIDGLRLNIEEIKAQLSKCSAKLDPSLEQTIKFGVAYHHSGLTLDERDIIEQAFKAGTLKALFATPTLSSGVNLPARRVIINGVRIGIGDMDPLMYMQMKGRAGRKGFDTHGESVLLAGKTKFDIDKALKLIKTKLGPIKSKAIQLIDNKVIVNDSFKRLTLESIANGLLQTREEIKNYLNSTLFAYQTRKFTDNEIETVLIELIPKTNPLIHQQLNDNNVTHFTASKLGEGILASSLSPEEGLKLFNELKLAMNGIALNCDLHLLYHVIPNKNMEEKQIKWSYFFEKLIPRLEKNSYEENVAFNLIKINRKYIQDQTYVNKISDKSLNRIKHNKFYYTLALQDIIKEKPLAEVSQTYSINKGELQNLQQRASSYCGMVCVFCKKLGWESLAALIKFFQDRLHFGIQHELIELMNISCLNGQMARLLYDAGYKDVKSIAHSNQFELENVFLKNVPVGETLKQFYVSNKCQGLNEKEISELVIKEARLHMEELIGMPLQWDFNESISIKSANTTPSKESSRDSSSFYKKRTRVKVKYCKDNLDQVSRNNQTTFRANNYSINYENDSKSAASNSNFNIDYQIAHSPLSSANSSAHSPIPVLSSTSNKEFQYNNKKRKLVNDKAKIVNSTAINISYPSDKSVIFSLNQQSSIEGSDLVIPDTQASFKTDRFELNHPDRQQAQNSSNSFSQPENSNSSSQNSNNNDFYNESDYQNISPSLNSGCLTDLESDQLCSSPEIDYNNQKFNLEVLSQSSSNQMNETDRSLNEENLFPTDDDEDQSTVKSIPSSNSISCCTGDSKANSTVRKLVKKYFYKSFYDEQIDKRCFEKLDQQAASLLNLIKSNNFKPEVRTVNGLDGINSFLDKFEDCDLFLIEFDVKRKIITEKDFLDSFKREHKDPKVKPDLLFETNQIGIMFDKNKVYVIQKNETVLLMKSEMIRRDFKFKKNQVLCVCFDGKFYYKMFKLCFKMSDENLNKIFWHDAKVGHWMLDCGKLTYDINT